MRLCQKSLHIIKGIDMEISISDIRSVIDRLVLSRQYTAQINPIENCRRSKQLSSRFPKEAKKVSLYDYTYPQVYLYIMILREIITLNIFNSLLITLFIF